MTSSTVKEPRLAELRRERKAVALRRFGGACNGCGLEFPARVFEFHHLNARTKDFAISVDGILRSWRKIEAELAKCVLLCANCHRETHAGLWTFTSDHAIGEATAAGTGCGTCRPRLGSLIEEARAPARDRTAA